MSVEKTTPIAAVVDKAEAETISESISMIASKSVKVRNKHCQCFQEMNKHCQCFESRADMHQGDVPSTTPAPSTFDVIVERRRSSLVRAPATSSPLRASITASY